MFYYLNEDNTYRKCDVSEWSNQFEDMTIQGTRSIAHEIVDSKRVSTVWLGIDHNHFGGNPMLFETMIFIDEDSGHDIYCDRYSTYEEAMSGHQKAVEWAKSRSE